MRTVHDLKDYAAIYHDCDEYDVKVWEPDTQRLMKLVFTGSSKPNDDNPNGEIHFNAYYQDNVGDNGVFDAFKEMAMMKGWASSAGDLRVLMDEFMEKILEKRNG